MFNLSDRANQLNFDVALPMSGPAPFGGGDFDDGRRGCGAKCDVNECLALLTHIARVERGQASHRITGGATSVERREGAASCLTAQLQHQANIGSAIEDFGKKSICRRKCVGEHANGNTGCVCSLAAFSSNDKKT